MVTSERVIAQRTRTGEILSREVPLVRKSKTKELSGPGGITGTVEPEMLQVIASDGRPLLEEWGTTLYVEQNGDDIRFGGIVSHIDYDASAQNVEAVGFSGYPNGQPFVGNYTPDNFPDPTAIIAEVWRHLQSFPNGNLGVTVDNTPTWMVAGNGSAAFKVFDYEARDCGDIINSVVSGVPLDFVETHSWIDTAKTKVDHRIKIGFPRLGRKRLDLRFAAGENILGHSAIGANGEDYSNDVYGFGEGSGPSMLKSRRTVDDGRMRRAKSVNFRSASKQAYLDMKTAEEAVRRSLVLDVTEVQVRDYPEGGVRIAAVELGDDIPVELNVPWLGRVQLWVRVLGITDTDDSPGTARFKTRRSDSFDYPAATSPTGSPVNIVL